MDLRAEASRLFQAAVAAANPATALRRALAAHPVDVPQAGGRYLVVAVGKAAVPMAREALLALTGAPVTALVVTNTENATALPGAKVMAAGHPVPDENGVAAGAAVTAALQGATAKDQVVALISGGGSALLPAPAPGLTLADKVAVSRLLLANGFEITEMNLIRQQLSQLKGGGMLRLAVPAPVSAYILSDVIGDDLRAIASGPTVAPLGTRGDARALLQGRGIWVALPVAVQRRLEETDPPAPLGPKARNHLIGSNRVSLEAARAASACPARIVHEKLTGDVADAAAAVCQAALAAPAGPVCLIFGGETTVTLTGKGKGGRNQELALRVATLLPDYMPEPGRGWAFLSGGTDGRDGPTEAAGGIVDAGTLARIRARGGDPAALLQDNDSNRALSLAGDLLVTGATGTNVADVQILMLAG
jgi:glycerate 2-kinase